MLYGGGHVQDSHLFDEMRFLHRYAEVGHLCRGVAPEDQSWKKGEDFQATGTTKTAATPEGIAAAVFPRQRPPQSVLADPGVVHIV